MEQRNLNNCNAGRKFKRMDKFGQSASLKIGEEGKEKLQTQIGSFCSIALILLVMMYTGYKLSILWDKKSIDILQVIKENHFDDSHVIEAK